MSGTYSHENRPGLDSGSPNVHAYEGAMTGALLGGMSVGRADELLLLLHLLLLLLLPPPPLGAARAERLEGGAFLHT